MITIWHVVIIAVWALIFGYWFRGYALKKWPNDQFMIHALAKKLGDQGEYEAKRLLERAKAYAAEVAAKRSE